MIGFWTLNSRYNRKIGKTYNPKFGRVRLLEDRVLGFGDEFGETDGILALVNLEMQVSLENK